MGKDIFAWSRQFSDFLDNLNSSHVDILIWVFMQGIWGSAFCATLAHYYKEIRPAFKGLAGFKGIDDLIEDSNDDLVKLHPVRPGGVPNFVLGLESHVCFSDHPNCPVISCWLEISSCGLAITKGTIANH